MSFGPFDIPPDRVSSLGVRFTPFVNKLLDLEVQAHNMQGHLLAINYNETASDAGVDAVIRESPGSDYIPTGVSAWQFKRSNFTPGACEKEFAKAKWAHDLIKDGGSYVMTIGAILPDKNLEDRRSKIAIKAIELGIIHQDDRSRIRVYDSNYLARWASRFPALTVSELAAGPGAFAVDFERWSDRGWHDTEWVDDEPRAAAIKLIREQLSIAEVVDLRVQGESGVGKTRLVMEALRTEHLQPLVAYVDDESQLTAGIVANLSSEGRRALLVVDQCPPENHLKLAEKLPKNPSIKLLTIGEKGPTASRVPAIEVDIASEEVIQEFLAQNYTHLSAEARRFVSNHSRGNLSWATILTRRIERLTDGQAADLIRRQDIESLITEILPEGRDFFLAGGIALFDRIGWDGDFEYQVGTLAEFANASVQDFDNVADKLELQGLLIRQGRFRKIIPHPLAIVLAAEFWRKSANRIVSQLFPRLDDGMALSLFRRVADLGRFEPARTVLPELLSLDGPFGSLDNLEANQSFSALLTQLAIVLPDEVAGHLGLLVDGTPLEELQGHKNSRRNLVWTLEKLAWHKRTFEAAADTLLRLALAENERYANNATGTWVQLFGTMLPGTAAEPNSRISYLQRTLNAEDPAVRHLGVKAAAQALDPHESITVSGELQGGALVEARGRPATWGDVGSYRNSAITLLFEATQDVDAEVAAAAEDALIAALHPLIADQFSGQSISDAAAQLTGGALDKLRTELERLIALRSRVKSEDDATLAGLLALRDRLPNPSAYDELKVLVQLSRWDVRGENLADRMRSLFERIEDEKVRTEFVAQLLESEAAGAYELGYSFGRVNDWSVDSIRTLLVAYPANPFALIGYLTSIAEESRATAFEDFLMGPLGEFLPHQDRVWIATRALDTVSLRQYIVDSIREITPSQGVQAIFGWRERLLYSEVKNLLADWTSKIVDQVDYNSVIQWVSLYLHGNVDAIDEIVEELWGLLRRRNEFPELRRAAHSWSQVATHLVPRHAYQFAHLILELNEAGSIRLDRHADEAPVLIKACSLQPAEVWEAISERLMNKSWRTSLSLRGWLIPHVEPEVVTSWVGSDLSRARVVAGLADIDDADERPPDVVRFLLAEFGDDEHVAGDIYGNFLSGWWVGNESHRIQGKIDQLSKWRNDRAEPVKVRRWATRCIGYLVESKKRALQREAEDFA